MKYDILSSISIVCTVICFVSGLWMLIYAFGKDKRVVFSLSLSTISLSFTICCNIIKTETDKYLLFFQQGFYEASIMLMFYYIDYLCVYHLNTCTFIGDEWREARHKCLRRIGIQKKPSNLTQKQRRLRFWVIHLVVNCLFVTAA